jgi:hypothetical protein
MKDGTGAIIAAACTVAAVAQLRAGCAKQSGGSRVVIGWMLLAASSLAWRCSVGGWDKAIALSLLAPSIVALLVIGASADTSRKNSKTWKSSPRSAAPLRRSSVLRAIGRVLIAGPVAGVAAVCLAAATALRAPWDDVDRLVAACFITPLAWAVGGVWGTSDPRLGRVSVTLCLIAGSSVAVAKS